MSESDHQTTTHTQADVPSGRTSWFWFILAALVLGLLYWIGSSSHGDLSGFSALVPYYSAMLVETTELDRLDEQVNAVPLWADGKQLSASNGMKNWILDQFSEQFGGVLYRDLIQFPQHFKRLGLCLYEDPATADRRLVFLAEKITPDRLPAVPASYAPASETHEDETLTHTLKTPDGGFLFALETPRFLVVSQSEAAITFSQQALHKRGKSLADLSPQLPAAPEAVLHAIIDPKRLNGLLRPRDPSFLAARFLSGATPTDDRFGPYLRGDIRIVSDWSLRSGDHMITESRIVQVSEPKLNSTSYGFFAIVGWIVVMLVAVIIGIPLALFLLMVLLALYFRLRIWLQGETIPPGPPSPLPELPDRMKEDLAGTRKRMQASRKKTADAPATAPKPEADTPPADADPSDSSAEPENGSDDQ